MNEDQQVDALISDFQTLISRAKQRDTADDLILCTIAATSATLAGATLGSMEGLDLLARTGVIAIQAGKKVPEQSSLIETMNFLARKPAIEV